MKAADLLRLNTLVSHFRNKGHQIATLDPLFDDGNKKLLKHVWHWRADKEARRLAKIVSVDPNEGNNTVDLSEAGFSDKVKEDTVVPEEALREIVGPHWEQIRSEPRKQGEIANCSLDSARSSAGPITVGMVLKRMYNSYCCNVSAEFTHVQTLEKFQWLSSHLESGPIYEDSARISQWKTLAKAVHFEHFLRKKYSAAKTYGLMGCEVLIPGLYGMFTRASALGVQHIELGMAHRGRLSVLANVMQKPLSMLFDEFNDDGSTAYVSDVKYHLGARASIYFGTKNIAKGLAGNDVVNTDAKRDLVLSLVPNPSHLELVNAVVLGKTRAVQHFLKDRDRNKAMAVMIHGDASFSGQGITAEVLELSNLPDYTTGGSLHIIINNQIGFTTDPHISRSSLHPTGAATAVGAPVFHVNGDDVDNTIRVFQLAAEYRQRFGEDCFIDVVCYRREGHNELDDPTITQPSVYNKISKHPNTLEIYEKSLAEDNLITLPDDSKRLASMINSNYEKEFQQARARSSNMKRGKATSSVKSTKLVRHQSNTEWMANNWKGTALGDLVSSGDRRFNMTGVRLKTLRDIGQALGTKSRALEALRLTDKNPEVVPSNLSSILSEDGQQILPIDIHPKIAKMMDSRASAVMSGKNIDMSTAEALAFGSLALPLREDEKDNSDVALNGVGYNDHPAIFVRLSGQDSERGTFNQRHAIVVCQKTERRFAPLNSIGIQRGELEENVYFGGEDNDVEHGDFASSEDEKNGVEDNMDLVNLPLTPATIAAATIKKSVHSWSPKKWDDWEDPWGQGCVKISNSNLSEAAALAFEYGHSLESKNSLTIWEAQFGDFANNAQSVIDNMIVSGEAKWNISSGLGKSFLVFAFVLLRHESIDSSTT